jgi:hypothetical protein
VGVAEFDAELYLRLTGERVLLGPGPGTDDGQLSNSVMHSAAHALVAVGAITAETAQAVVNDYRLAWSYRSREGRHHHQVLGTARLLTSRPALGPVRAVPCGRLIERPWGQLFLGYLALTDEVTTLHVSMRPAPSQPSQSSRQVRRQGVMRSGAGGSVLRAGNAGGPGPGPGGRTVGPGLPGRLTVTDDRGTTATANFSGEGDDSGWRGEFEASPALAVGTAWIEVLGERVELPSESGSATRVWVEPRTEASPARGYLWTKLASLAEFPSPGSMDTPIETLVAAGALASEDPAIAEIRAVVNGLFHGSGATPAFRAQLPEPWRSMLARRGQASGPKGLVVTGVMTPPVGGFTLAVLAVHSTGERFAADVRTAPGVPHLHWFPGPLDQPELAWWAADDRGHHYVGHMETWRYSPDGSGGQIHFWPALDPAAAVLDIMPTTMAARAIIRIPLAWGQDQ